MDGLNLQVRYEYLASKWRNNTITAEEQSELFNWLTVNEEIIITIPNSFAKSETDLRNIIFEQINQGIVQNQKLKRLKIWERIAVAAAVVLIVGSGIWFYTSYGPDKDQLRIVAKNDIAPGKNAATLMLSNGKVISLSDAMKGIVIKNGNIRYNFGSPSVGAGNIHTLRSSEQLTMTTPPGGTYELILPDGTKVWLNAASVLKFPSDFSKSRTRRVELIGEAYFEVVKGSRLKISGGRSVSERTPFVVKTDRQEVEVLGTHFNINSYADEESVKTTLLEGSVRVTAISGSLKKGKVLQRTQPVMLKPNQQSILSGNMMEVKQVDTEAIVDWKNNDFVFNGVDFKTAMRKIARWYNVEIVYDTQLPVDIDPGGWISRNNKLSVVLDRIESSGQVHFKIEGRRVYVTR